MEFTELDGLKITTATAYDKIVSNIELNLSSTTKKIHQIDAWRSSKAIALIGGGPSLVGTLERAKLYQHTMAVGSSHDYIISNGLIPKWCIVCDPDPLVIEYMKLKHKDVKYLLSTQCDASVFEHLKDHDVYMWNCAGSDEDNEKLFPKTDPLIYGGCTVGTRALAVAMDFGFVDVHLFGYDSCLEVIKDGNGERINHHAYKFETDAEDIGEISLIQLGKDSPTFKVAGYMLAQVFDFKKMLEMHADKLRIEVFGDGPLKYIIDYGKNNFYAKEE